MLGNLEREKAPLIATSGNQRHVVRSSTNVPGRITRGIHQHEVAPAIRTRDSSRAEPPDEGAAAGALHLADEDVWLAAGKRLEFERLPLRRASPDVNLDRIAFCHGVGVPGIQVVRSRWHLAERK